MLAITANRANEIRRASRALLVLFIFMNVITLWSMLSNVAHPFPPGIRTLAGVDFQIATITGKIESLWYLQLVLGAALNLKVLYHFIRLLRLFSNGKLFTAQNVAQIRQVGLTFFCAVPIWLIVLVCAAPEIAAAQDQWVKVMPSFPGGALMGGIFFLFATRLMSEARELRDEQDLVV